jgi:CubicO group peptidase (beta-lactamase class C family)
VRLFYIYVNLVSMNKAISAGIIASIFVVFVIPARLCGQQKQAEDFINGMIQNKEAVGISVAVVKKNKILYAGSFGMKDLANNIPLGNEDIFRIASISKSFSATAVMQLVEEKKISLDQDISGLVGFTVRNPAFPEKVITVAMMLSHRSSLNDSQGYFTLDAINPAKNPDWAKCYNAYEPGTGYMYCNLNYNMIGTVIEKITGERFDTYIKRRILTPLHLYGGYCVDSLDRSRFANIYEYNADSAAYMLSTGAYAPRREELAKYVYGYSTPVFSPTGGMKISASDLARYMIMHSRQGRYDGVRIISKKSARRMQTPYDGKVKYGFAISIFDSLIPGKTVKGHTGSAYGLYSIMLFEPKEKWGIVVISNGCLPAYENGFNKVIAKTVQSLYANFLQ